MDFKEAVTKAQDLYETAKVLNEQAQAMKADALATIEKAQEATKKAEELSISVAKREAEVKEIENSVTIRNEANATLERIAKEGKDLNERIAAFNKLEAEERAKIASEWTSIQSTKEALAAAQEALNAEKETYKDQVLAEVRQKLG